MIFDDIYRWINLNTTILNDKKIEVAENYISPKDIEKPGIWIDFTNPGHYSRITVWNTGDCVIEVLDYETGQSLFWEERKLENDRDINLAFRELFKQM